MRRLVTLSHKSRVPHRRLDSRISITRLRGPAQNIIIPGILCLIPWLPRLLSQTWQHYVLTIPSQQSIKMPDKMKCRKCRARFGPEPPHTELKPSLSEVQREIKNETLYSMARCSQVPVTESCPSSRADLRSVSISTQSTATGQLSAATRAFPYIVVYSPRVLRSLLKNLNGRYNQNCSSN